MSLEEYKNNSISIKTRSSNIELLRILTMIAIIMHHSIIHRIWDSSSIALNNILIHCTSFLGPLCNSIFMIISGFFLCKSQFCYKKALRTWTQMFFYSILLGFLIYGLNILPYAADTDRKIKILNSLFPFIRNNNWYASTYLIFFFISPLLKIIIDNINQKQHFLVVTGCFIFFIAIPSIPFSLVNPTTFLLTFIIFYFVGSYLRFYDFRILKKQIIVIVLLITSVFIILFISFCKYTGKYHLLVTSNPFTELIYSSASFFCPILVFSFFKNLKISNSKIINFFAAATFGVYLFHDNIIIRYGIWHIIDFNKWINSYKLIAYLFVYAILIFIIGIIIDFVRKITFDKVINKYLN